MAYLFINAYANSSPKEKYGMAFLQTAFSSSTEIMATYFHLYFLVPRFLLKKRYNWFVILFLITFIAVVIYARVAFVYFQYPIFYHAPLPESFKFWNLRELSFCGIYIYAVIFLACSIKLLKHWMQSQQQRNELEMRNREGEIALLRMQVNPHFLFNTLNNIHALININKDRAADALVMLSDIMRYMLYDTNTNKVPLENEIQYIQSFIELQKFRLVNPDIVEYSVEGSISGKLVAPMILIPFIENAFKHAEKQDKFKKIKIKIFVDKEFLLFETSNNIAENRGVQISKSGGIGLKNVRRRLELIYPGKYELQIKQENNLFLVQLILKEI